MRTKTKVDRGVAGLTILLSLVTMLFTIGLLVMIFALMGGELQDATYDNTAVTVTNETVTGLINTTGTGAVTGASTLNFGSFAVTTVHNSSDGSVLAVANYTANTDGTLVNATVIPFPYEVNVSYSYNYDATNTATDVMNDTTTSVGTVTDWFPIFIVIGAMVVLILLTVIIITAIRGSGLMAGGGA